MRTTFSEISAWAALPARQRRALRIRWWIEPLLFPLPFFRRLSECDRRICQICLSGSPAGPPLEPLKVLK
jgi:hypothetical protein